MTIPFCNLAQRQTLVLSCDRAVVLRALPQSAEEKAQNKPIERELRRPLRALRVEDVEQVGAEALRFDVRVLDRDEQLAVVGGLAALNSERMSAAAHRALPLAVTAITRGGQSPIDARSPAEVAAYLKMAHTRFVEPVGLWIVDEALGYHAPFDDDGSV